MRATSDDLRRDRPVGILQPFAWAFDRLREEFGDPRVAALANQDGGQITAEIAPAEGAAVPGVDGAYTVILRDPVLGNANRQADPPAWLAAEIGFAHAWFAGESRRRRTFG